MTSHILQDIEYLCSRVIVVNHGVVVADLPIQDFLRLIAGMRKVLLRVRNLTSRVCDYLKNLGFRVEMIGDYIQILVHEHEVDSVFEIVSRMSKLMGCKVLEFRTVESNLEDILASMYRR